MPERREELTTEGGLDVVLNSVQIRPMVKTLQEAGIEVSLFVDPELEQVKEAHKLDAAGDRDQHRRLVGRRRRTARARRRCAR